MLFRYRTSLLCGTTTESESKPKSNTKVQFYIVFLFLQRLLSGLYHSIKALNKVVTWSQHIKRKSILFFVRTGDFFCCNVNSHAYNVLAVRMPLFGKSQKSPAELVKALKEAVNSLERGDKKAEKAQEDVSKNLVSASTANASGM